MRVSQASNTDWTYRSLRSWSDLCITCIFPVPHRNLFPLCGNHHVPVILALSNTNLNHYDRFPVSWNCGRIYSYRKGASDRCLYDSDLWWYRHRRTFQQDAECSPLPGDLLASGYRPFPAWSFISVQAMERKRLLG